MRKVQTSIEEVFLTIQASSKSFAFGAQEWTWSST
jgi:hypothetical protein